MNKVVFAVNLVGQTTPAIQTIEQLLYYIDPLIQNKFLTCLEPESVSVDFIDNSETGKIAQAVKSGATVVHIDANMLRALSNTLQALNFDITRFNERVFDANGALDTEKDQVDFTYTVNNVAQRWYGLIDMTLPIFNLSAPNTINPERLVAVRFHWQNIINPTYLFDVCMGHIEAKDSFFDMKAYSVIPSIGKLSIEELKDNEFFMALEEIPYFKGTLRQRLKRLVYAWIDENSIRLTALVKFNINTMVNDQRFADLKAYMEQLDQQPISVSGAAIPV